MEAYAVIETGGKQYLVRKNSKLDIERLPGEAGATIELAPVLACSDGASLKVGTPAIAGAKVVARVVKQFKARKVVAFKKKRRKGYKKKIGHRQQLTRVEIADIIGG